jgi:WD40 repeat protein
MGKRWQCHRTTDPSISTTGTVSARTRCQGHQGKITNIDFSRDGQYLMSNCTSGELLFWSTQSGEQQVAKDMRDTEWVYASCPLSYGTSGFLPLFLDETRLVASNRSNAGGLVAVGDNHGRVRLARFPCTERDTNFLTCRGHGSVVSNVRFAFDDSALFTCGAQDGCVIQWSVHYVGVDNSAVGKLEVLPVVCSFASCVSLSHCTEYLTFSGDVCWRPEGVGD